MRKTRLAVPLVSLLLASVGVAGAALAASERVNTYATSGRITGGKGATSKAPRPVGLTVDYTVGERSGLRPLPVRTYAIFVGGTRADNTALPGCDLDRLIDGGDPSVCPKGSIVGSGRTINRVGVAADPADESLYCYLTVTLINSTRRGHLLIHYKGVQSDPDPQKQCAIQVSEAIDATFTSRGGGTVLQFTVPDNLLHPASLDNAVTDVRARIDKRVVTRKGKRVALLAAYRCVRNATPLTVSFTPESGGPVATAKTVARCN